MKKKKKKKKKEKCRRGSIDKWKDGRDKVEIVSLFFY